MYNEDKCIKAINFDLDTKKLKEYYPSKHWRKAYGDLKKFFKKQTLNIVRVQDILQKKVYQMLILLNLFLI